MLANIATTLWNAGFIIETAKNHNAVIVSLNRQINTMEVKAALNFDESVNYSRIGDKVAITSK